MISIHAPRTGSDKHIAHILAILVISIHAPRTGSDTIFAIRHSARKLFQSTLPARGATTALEQAQAQVVISIHAPRTGSDVPNFSSIWSTIGISIHAPRTGSDSYVLRERRPRGYFNPRSPHGERPKLVLNTILMKSFQSTLPARGATLLLALLSDGFCISIHAPRTGSDRG